MEQVVSNFLDGVELGTKQEFGNLIIFPLRTKQTNEFEYLTLKDALAKNFLRVSEISEGGSVPELAVINEGNVFVLLLDGEETERLLFRKLLPSDFGVLGRIAQRTKNRLPAAIRYGFSNAIKRDWAE